MCIFASKRLFSLHDTDSFVLKYTEPEIQVGDYILGTNFGDQPRNVSNVSGNTAVAIIRVSGLRGRHAGYGSGAPNTRTTPTECLQVHLRTRGENRRRTSSGRCGIFIIPSAGSTYLRQVSTEHRNREPPTEEVLRMKETTGLTCHRPKGLHAEIT